MDGTQASLVNETSDASNRTVLEWILERYRSPRLDETILGFWAKLIVEFAIVAFPVAVIVFPIGIGLQTLGLIGGTPSHLVGLWGVLSVTTIQFTWCFTAESARTPSSTA